MIRTRLVATVVAALAVVLIVSATSVFLITRAGVLSELGRDVDRRADAVVLALEEGEPDRELATRFGGPDVVVAVYDGTDRRLVDSGKLRTRIPEPADLGLLGSGEGVHEIDVDGPLYVTTRSATSATGDELTVIVGRSPERLYETLARLLAVLVPATAVTLIVSGLAVSSSLGRALRPLEALDVETRRVADAGDHEARIVGRYRDDEIGALAGSVDSMLASLADKHHEVQESTRIQREFLADVSHELRAPLAVVGSSIELARRTVDDDRLQHDQLLDDALDELARMGRIVSQLLLMARTGAELTTADRPLLVGELTAGVGGRWAATEDVTIDCTGLGPIANVVVSGNSDHLTQVFDALLDNAVKFTPPSGRIELIGMGVDDTVVIEVSDTGIGIAPTEIDRVFDRFYKGHDGGTGLGLAIALHLVEQHGGTMSATSPPSGGTTVRVELPLIEANTSEPQSNLPAR